MGAKEAHVLNVNVIFAAIVLLVLAAKCSWSDDRRAYAYDGYHSNSLALRGLPPFDVAQSGFLDNSSKPLESQGRFKIADYVLRMQTAYQERHALLNPFTRERSTRNIFALQARTDLLNEQLQGEAEIAYNSLDANGSRMLGQERVGLYRFNFHGRWRGYRYGTEFRSVQKGFMHFRGDEAHRSEDSIQFWGESRVGAVNVKARLSQLWENLNEASATPRVTRGSEVSFNYRKNKWNTLVSSAYNVRQDHFDGGATADLYAMELRTTYQPIAGFKIMPRFAYSGEHRRDAAVRTESPLGSLTLSYESWRKWFTLSSHTQFQWSRSSDRLSHVRDFSSTIRWLWQLDKTTQGRKTLSLEMGFSHHRDLVIRGNSTGGFSTRLMFTLLKF